MPDDEDLTHLVGPPPPFDWDTAHELAHRDSARATVMGLSMISEQLDHLIRSLSNG